MRTPKTSLVRAMIPGLALFFFMLESPAIHAQVTWNAGGGADKDWMSALFPNWGGISPASQPVVFGTSGLTTSSSTVTNIVNEDVSVTSLTYQYNDASKYQVTQINTGATLTVGGTSSVFTVGGLFTNGTSNNTKTVITGGGKLAIDQSGGTVFIGSNAYGSGTPSPTGIVQLNMQGLSEFSANLGNSSSFSVGSSTLSNSPSGTQRSFATVYLADKNTLTANYLFIGSSRITTVPLSVYSTSGTNSLNLGRTNTLNFNTIDVASLFGGSGLALMRFDPAVLGNNPTVTIRAQNGTGAVNLFELGRNTNGDVGSGLQDGTVDFSGGTVDAKILNLVMGSGNSNNPAGYGKGVLTMDQGIIEVANVNLGQTAAITSTIAATTPNEGIINIKGGTFTVSNNLTLANRVGGQQGAVGTVNISGSGQMTSTSANGIVMGNLAGGSGTSALVATINLDGGSLTVAGNIAEGTSPGVITSAINLRGGTLDMAGKNIVVDTFNAENGTLKNLGQLNSGGTFTKSSTGTLTVEGMNSWTGQTVISGGILVVNGTHSGGGAYNVMSGGTLGGSGTIATAGNAGATLAAGGKFSPGNLTLSFGTGTLDISAGVTAAASGALMFDLGSTSDKITLGGTLDIGSGVLEFDDFVFSGVSGFAPGSYTLFSTNHAISGSLGSLLTGLVEGYAAEIKFANAGQDLILNVNVIPEPSSVLLICLAGGLLGCSRRSTSRE